MRSSLTKLGEEGWPGDGSEDDPYIIQGYKIDGENQGYGVSIRDTESFFILRDCYIFNASGYPYPTHGVELHGVRYGVIENNTIAYNEGDGIYLRESDSNKLVDNELFDNGRSSIRIVMSKNHTLTGNRMVNNGIVIRGDIFHRILRLIKYRTGTRTR